MLEIILPVVPLSSDDVEYLLIIFPSKVRVGNKSQACAQIVYDGAPAASS